MKVIIAGSRDIGIGEMAVYSLMRTAPFFREMTHLISGGAKGVDTYAVEWAKRNDIPFSEYKPDYEKYPTKVAPIMRNKLMADNADALIAIWNGKSRGTKNMIDEAKARNLKIHIVIIQIGAKP